ncbi:MAG: hypothetical protein M1829_005460 [Trizodia sp. TS-e1964]|nr:MAG: hypothetical protein M1829_005460 [Trizodia sp. TS-e1964]
MKKLEDFLTKIDDSHCPNLMQAGARTFKARVSCIRMLARNHAPDPIVPRRLFRRLQDLGIAESFMYDKLAEDFQRARNLESIAWVFLHHPRKSKSGPGSKSLRSLLAHFRREKNEAGIRWVLEMWERYFQGPNRIATYHFMSHYALQGQLPTVKSLFEYQIKRYGEPYYQSAYGPLMLVQAKRGDLLETVKMFNDLHARYGFDLDLKFWNILLSAYARIDDIDGALEVFNRIAQETYSGPDRFTFAILLGICANRGDIDGANDIFDMFKPLGLEITAQTIACLVQAHTMNNDLARAETIVMEASKIKLRGPKTAMWNQLIRTHARQASVKEASRLFRLMEELGIPQDSATYGALMEAHVARKDTDIAQHILTDVMPVAGQTPSAYHFAVLIRGWSQVGNFRRAMEVYNMMDKYKILPNFGTNVPLIRAAATKDSTDLLQKYDIDNIPSHKKHLKRAEKLLDNFLVYGDLGDHVSPHPLGGTGSVPNPAAYFSFVIRICGRIRAFELAQSYFLRYQNMVNHPRLKGSNFEPPVELISAIMYSYLLEKNYTEVERCWDLVYSSAAKLSETFSNRDTSKQGWVLSPQKYKLCKPLRYYITALGAQKKFKEADQIMEKVQWDGYAIDVRCFNQYILVILPSREIVRVFQLCENNLMKGWGGWRRQRRQRNLSSSVPKYFGFLEGRPFYPEYKTLVYLAATYKYLRKNARSNRESMSSLKTLQETCPLTLEAIISMPMKIDGLQETLLRNKGANNPVFMI